MGLLLEQETPEQFFCCYGRYQAYLETPDEKKGDLQLAFILWCYRLAL